MQTHLEYTMSNESRGHEGRARETTLACDWPACVLGLPFPIVGSFDRKADS